MRFLRRQTLNRRAVYDNSLYIDTNNNIVMGTSNTLVLPQGTTNGTTPRPYIPAEGMIRYNTTTSNVEVYQGSNWRSLRYKESTKIVQQNLGAGDSATVYFGPLNSLYSPTKVSSENDNFAGQNILVVVENVLQLAGSNYTVVQNPTLSSQVYQPTVSESAIAGSTLLAFSTSLTVSATGASGGIATLIFNTQAQNPFRVGQTILVTGINPVEYNGSFTVTSVSPSSVSYTSSATGSMTVSGQVTGAGTVYPGTPIVGATVTGTNIQSATLVQSIVTEPYTNALISITLSKPTSGGTIAAGTTLTINEGTQVGSGYYLFFSSPPPYGKIVTALLGFDQ
jgi:hypothetical protein